MQHPLRRWLSLRIRILCAVCLLTGSLLPPYIPPDALANQEAIDIDTPQLLLVEDGFLMKSSSLTEQGSRRIYAEWLTHVVRDGEKLTQIAAQYQVKPETIIWVNKLPANTPVKAGQELIILPVDGVLHTVTRGQTLSRIAELYSIPTADIRAQNKLEGDFILAGQELIVPGAKPIVDKPTQVAAVPGTTPKPGAKPVQVSPGKKPDVAATPSYGVLQMPCNNCYYTQYFGPGHYAVDIQTKGGGPIFAAEDGTVIRADGRKGGENGGSDQWNGGYGNVIEVSHGNGLVTLYAHNKELYVNKGDTIKRGQVIAWMGRTGRVYGKTGIHTHFEVRVNGVKKNPLLYLK